MAITRRLLAPIAIQDKQNHVVSVDLGAFVQRLLLFETYILQSVWLEDLALLTRTLDPSGLVQLFQAGALKIYCESYTIGETGRARADLGFRDNNKRLPLGSYSFSVLRVRDQEQKIERALRDFPSTLQEEATRNLILMPQEFSSKVFDGFYGDIRPNPRIAEAAVKLELQKQGIKPRRLKLSVKEVEPEDFRVENNLMSEYGLSENTAHQIVAKSLLAIANLNKRFAEMMTHSALSGITDEDIPLLQGKLEVVAMLIESSNQERQFHRVVNIIGLPAPIIGETKIDVEKLLKVRDSDECRAFRSWLAETDSVSDKELKDRLAGLNSRMREAINSKWGKRMRFAVSNGLSLMGPIAGLAASAVDSFILERLAPKDAIVSFLSESYPSVFTKGRLD